MTQAQTQALQALMTLLAPALQDVAVPQAKVAPKVDRLASKDASILRTFKKRGIKDVVLMDRNDPKKPFNVRPFGKKFDDGRVTGWLGQGRVVKKGEKSVKGLFHISQTEKLPEATA